MLQQITILPELEAYLPALASEEATLLEQSLLKDGCQEPLEVWSHEGKTILIDGHNRFRICTQHSLSYQIREKSFEDMDDVKEYMMNKQLARRNLTDAQRTYFLGTLYEQRKKKLKKLENLTPFQNNPELLEKFVSSELTERDNMSLSGNDLEKSESTAEKLAQEQGVSDKTVKRAAEFKEGLDEIIESLETEEEKQEVKKALLGETVKVPKSAVSDFSKISSEEDKKALAKEIAKAVDNKEKGAVKTAFDKVKNASKGKKEEKDDMQGLTKSSTIKALKNESPKLDDKAYKEVPLKLTPLQVTRNQVLDRHFGLKLEELQVVLSLIDIFRELYQKPFFSETTTIVKSFLEILPQLEKRQTEQPDVFKYTKISFQEMAKNKELAVRWLQVFSYIADGEMGDMEQEEFAKFVHGVYNLTVDPDSNYLKVRLDKILKALD